MQKQIKVLVVGTGFMGSSHARAYHRIENVEIVGLVAQSIESSKKLSDELGGGIECFDNYIEALDKAQPDAVSINCYTGFHYEYAKEALNRGLHIFVEKPLTETVKESEELVALATEKKVKMTVGYILRHHPAWTKFIDISKTMGKPLVMRMNLNQQSKGKAWTTHKNIMKSQSPIVDCGVHYVDVMCQMTQSRPVKVHAIGARLSDEIAEDMYNYGQLQIQFEDGSCGWYEAGWGPMMSNQHYFIKDVVGPKGSVSIVVEKSDSDDVNSHTKTNTIAVHPADIDSEGNFTKENETISMEGEPDHDELCYLEQCFFINAICNDVDLTEHMQNAIDSLKIVVAADKSFREGGVVEL